MNGFLKFYFQASEEELRLDARDLKLALSTLKRGSRLSLEWEVREEVQGILVVLFEIFETAVFFKVH